MSDIPFLQFKQLILKNYSGILHYDCVGVPDGVHVLHGEQQATKHNIHQTNSPNLSAQTNHQQTEPTGINVVLLSIQFSFLYKYTGRYIELSIALNKWQCFKGQY